MSPDELRRYDRHLLVPEIGMEGQRRLNESRLLVIGAGGLGSPLLLYLAAAGVGHLTIVDPDIVDESNLQRQVLHGTADLGLRKVDSARRRLHDLNPYIAIETIAEPFTSRNAMEIARGHDLIVDGTDNFPTRYLSNDVAVLLGMPNVYGSIFRFEGQVSVFWAERGPCYRCLYPEPPPPGLVPSCAEGGVLGILPGVVGSMQATEAIKILIGIGEPLIGRLLLYDALAMRFRDMRIRKDPACPVCGEHPTIRELIDYEEFCGVPALGEEGGSLHHQRNKTDMAVQEITVEEFASLRERGTPHVLIDVREENEYAIANMGARLVPLSRLGDHVDEIPREGRVIIHCRSGARSARAIEYLQSLGYTNLENLKGGILAWSAMGGGVES